MKKNDKINIICDMYNISKIWAGESKYMLFNKDYKRFNIDLYGINKYKDLEFLIKNKAGLL